MELALKISEVSEIKELTRNTVPKNIIENLQFEYSEKLLMELSNIPVSRIYYGSEFCQNLIPSIDEIKNVITECKKRNLKFTFLTPSVNDEGLSYLKTIIEHIKNESIEITINDIGVFQMIKIHYPFININYGRIMDKTYHDVRFNKGNLQNYCNTDGQNYFTQLSFNSNAFSDFFLNTIFN